MFSEPTVFVVGAGASAEYKIAVGDSLKFKIADLLDLHFDWSELTRGDYQIVEWLRRHNQAVSGSHKVSDQDFKSARLISQAMPHALSIDNFIDAHRGNESIALCAKLGIVKAILLEEVSSRISGLKDEFQPFDFASVADTWIPRLFQMLSEGVSRDDIHRVFENLTLIVFNYDRCVEAYLPRALREYYDLQPAEVSQIMARLKIIHPYGVAGRPDEIERLTIPFGSSDVNLLDASQGIRTFSEGVGDATIKSGLTDALSSADTLVFLGFSFHPLNMKLLKAPTNNLRRVFATTYGLSKSAVANVEQSILQMFDKLDPRQTLLDPDERQLDELEMANLKAYDFCTQYFRSLSSAVPVIW
ncbi:hypothetical protein G7078_10620 [Sphingomonas sinipercae]|uniref:SIR2-like domain-containing protein n=1 Tax=Sphingomonas sinipercae TaxID=2714944 RepID=A0A6G7ZQK7_9SPHN|nr:hypothetical protein [Sphingomonas sinipercae]QIL03186.1 hypothetical protein G7078_10620 [Sphingomonas sinipercae]